MKSLSNDDEKISIMIYYLTNTNNPLLRFEKGEFLNVTQAFYNQINEKKVIFVLKSHYVIYEI